MTRPRFQSRGVEHRGGRTVVRIFDQVLNEEIKVYKRGHSYLRWDNDLRIRNAALRRAAHEAICDPVISSLEGLS